MPRNNLPGANQHTIAATGLTVTGLAVATMTSGANNGVEIPYVPGSLILLKNDTGASRVFTFKAKADPNKDALGLANPDFPKTVPTATEILIPANAEWYQPASEEIFVDCDGAGKIALIRLR